MLKVAIKHLGRGRLAPCKAPVPKVISLRIRSLDMRCWSNFYESTEFVDSPGELSRSLPLRLASKHAVSSRSSSKFQEMHPVNGEVQAKGSNASRTFPRAVVKVSSLLTKGRGKFVTPLLSP